MVANSSGRMSRLKKVTSFRNAWRIVPGSNKCHRRRKAPNLNSGRACPALSWPDMRPVSLYYVLLLRAALGLQPSVESSHVDNHALVRAGADLLHLVAGADVKFDSPSVHFRHFGLRDDLRSEEHTSELQSRSDLVCRLLLEK